MMIVFLLDLSSKPNKLASRRALRRANLRSGAAASTLACYLVLALALIGNDQPAN